MARQTADRLADETEQLGHLHSEVVAQLVESGLLRGWVAEEYGGRNATVREVLGEIEAVSRADGASGWCVMIANTTGLTSHYLPADWASEIYSDPAVCTGGFGMPAGTATVVDGGLKVSGRWAWGSGTSHCTWIGGGVRVVDADGEPTSTRDGAVAPFVFFEPSQVELLDTWHVSGMKGTASTDYTVTDAFVPEGRWAQLFDSKPHLDSSLGRFPFFGALAAGVAAVIIGLAERAVDELTDMAERKPSGSSKSMAERATTQNDLALARANVGQARAYLYQMVDDVWVATNSGVEITDEERTNLRLAASAAAKRSVEAVDICYHAAGSGAVYETSVLQRVFRDAHVAVTHGMVAPRTLEAFGRFHFGLPTNTTLF